MKGSGQITEVQLRDGDVSSEPTSPADTVCLGCCLANRQLRNGGKPPKPTTSVINVSTSLGFLFLICTMRAVSLVIKYHSFVKMWNLFKSHMSKRGEMWPGGRSNNHDDKGVEYSKHSPCTGHCWDAHMCHVTRLSKMIWVLLLYWNHTQGLIFWQCFALKIVKHP